MDINALKNALKNGQVVLDRGALVVTDAERDGKGTLTTTSQAATGATSRDAKQPSDGIVPEVVQLKPTVWA